MVLPFSRDLIHRLSLSLSVNLLYLPKQLLLLAFLGGQLFEPH